MENGISIWKINNPAAIYNERIISGDITVAKIVIKSRLKAHQETTVEKMV